MNLHCCRKKAKVERRKNLNSRYSISRNAEWELPTLMLCLRAQVPCRTGCSKEGCKPPKSNSSTKKQGDPYGTFILGNCISIFIGVLTNILTPHISNLFAKLSNSIKEQNEKKKVVFENSVQYLLDNPHQEVIFKINYMQTIISQLILLFFSVFLMFSAHLIVVMAGFLFSLTTYYSILRINNRRKIGEELLKRRKASNPEVDLS